DGADRELVDRAHASSVTTLRRRFLAAAERACERDRLDPACTRGAESTRGRRGGGAGRVDVVDHGDLPGRGTGRAEGAAHGPALDSGAASLATAARPLEERQ